MSTKGQYDKLYKMAKDRAIRAAGGVHPFRAMLAPSLRRAMVSEEILFIVYTAMVSEEILFIVYTQDESVPAELVRRLVSELRERLTSDDDVML